MDPNSDAIEFAGSVAVGVETGCWGLSASADLTRSFSLGSDKGLVDLVDWRILAAAGDLFLSQAGAPAIGVAASSGGEGRLLESGFIARDFGLCVEVRVLLTKVNGSATGYTSTADSASTATVRAKM